MICEKAKERMEEIKKIECEDWRIISEKFEKILESQKYLEEGICIKCGGNVKEQWYNIILYFLSLGIWNSVYKCDSCGKSIRRLSDLQSLYIQGNLLY